jgi:hypothetical protein
MGPVKPGCHVEAITPGLASTCLLPLAGHTGVPISSCVLPSTRDPPAQPVVSRRRHGLGVKAMGGGRIEPIRTPWP